MNRQVSSQKMENVITKYKTVKVNDLSAQGNWGPD